jgi:putative iron-dependent peroxidase
MFEGISAGHHDRILDFSTSMTGTTFFAPSYSMLKDLG